MSRGSAEYHGLMKTWKGDQDLPPVINDEFAGWMEQTANAGEADRSTRPPLVTRTTGDPDLPAEPS